MLLGRLIIVFIWHILLQATFFLFRNLYAVILVFDLWHLFVWIFRAFLLLSLPPFIFVVSFDKIIFLLKICFYHCLVNHKPVKFSELIVLKIIRNDLFEQSRNHRSIIYILLVLLFLGFVFFKAKLGVHDKFRLVQNEFLLLFFG